MDGNIILAQALVAFIAGLIGVAVGYGALRNQVQTNKADIQELKKDSKSIKGNPGEGSLYMTRAECDKRSENLEKQVREVQQQLESQERALQKIQNFSRWFLISKEKMNLVEVDKILNGE